MNQPDELEKIPWPKKLQTAYPAAKWTEEYFPILNDLLDSMATPPEVIESAVDQWCLENLEPYKLPTPWQLASSCRAILGGNEVSDSLSESSALLIRRYAKERIYLMAEMLQGRATVVDLSELRDRMIFHGLESNAAALTKRIKHWSVEAIANEAAQAVTV